MALDASIRKILLCLALPTGILFLVKNRYLSCFNALVVVSCVFISMALLIGDFFEINKLIEYISSFFLVLALYCLSYSAIVFKNIAPEFFIKKSNKKWKFESLMYLVASCMVFLGVNLRVIFIVYLRDFNYQNFSTISSVVMLLLYMGLVYIRASQLFKSL